MPANNKTEIEGFEELKNKIKQLPERIKRREVLKIQRQLAKPLVNAYRSALPVGVRPTERRGTIYPVGSLSKSVSAKTVPKSKVPDGNPQVVVRPGKRGKWDGWYRFMVVSPGTVLRKSGTINKSHRHKLPKADKYVSFPSGHHDHGTLKRHNNDVVKKARDAAWNKQSNYVTEKYKEQLTKYIQKNIDKLSNQ